MTGNSTRGIRLFFQKYRVLLGMGLPLVVFAVLAVLIVNDQTAGFDSAIYHVLSSMITPQTTQAFIFLTNLCSPAFLIGISILLLAFFLFRHKLYPALAIPINLLISSVINTFAKSVFDRPRPDINQLVDVGGFSFPSGHSFVAISFYGFLIYLVARYCRGRYKYPLMLLLFLVIPCVGISRVYLGVHYSSDVLAGFSLGGAWLAFYIFLAERIRHTLEEKKGGSR